MKSIFRVTYFTRSSQHLRPHTISNIKISSCFSTSPPPRKMSSSNQDNPSASANTPNDQNSTTEANAPNTKDQNQTSNTPLPLPEPAQDGQTTIIDMSTGGQTVKLDHMGPLVVNKDGTLSRISNWGEMSEIERANTVRILGKRNMLRREALAGQEGEKNG
jgi:hypothetical protein